MEISKRGRAITTTYDYSPLNEIVQITDDQGNVTRMAYDFLGAEDHDLATIQTKKGS